MPMYPYLCPACNREFDTFSHIDADHTSAPCPCGGTAMRVWTVPQAIVDNTDAYFNHGLGKVVSSKHDIREAQRRYAGETGSALIEMGNEKSWRAKRVRIPYPSVEELLHHG